MTNKSFITLLLASTYKNSSSNAQHVNNNVWFTFLYISAVSSIYMLLLFLIITSIYAQVSFFIALWDESERGKNFVWKFVCCSLRFKGDGGRKETFHFPESSFTIFNFQWPCRTSLFLLSWCCLPNFKEKFFNDKKNFRHHEVEGFVKFFSLHSFPPFFLQLNSTLRERI